MRILHLITSLGIGGAESQLTALAISMRDAGHEVRVLSLLPGGENTVRLRNAGVVVEDLGIRQGLPLLSALWRLIRILRSWQPQIVQSWLYHADVLATMANRLARGRALVWNLRCSTLDPRDHSRLLFLLIRLLARWSQSPDAVIVNSMAGREFHTDIGYRPRCWYVIPNAIDITRYSPSDQARVDLRAELGLDADALVIGMVARYHPMKDHHSFLSSLRPVVAAQPTVQVVLVGPGIDEGNTELHKLIDQAGLSARVHLLGARTDMPRLQAAWDVAVSASYSEGFSNTIAEAMACGVPCVCTVVGDAAVLVGDTGRLVPASDPAAMGAALCELLAMPGEQRWALGAAARRRIETEYSLPEVTKKYLATYYAVSMRAAPAVR